MKKYLFPNRIEAQGKWWHRLALAIIYGSSILVLIYCIILVIGFQDSNLLVTAVTLIIIPLVFFVLLRSILYGAVLYIMYGKNKVNN
jgi:uncharacterized membrane protein YjgN (DUF898 family)